MSEQIRLGLVVGDERDRFAPTTMAALMKAGFAPVAVVSAFPQSAKARARQFAGDTYRGIQATLGQTVNLADEALIDYAQAHGLDDYGPLAHTGNFAANHDIDLVHVPSVNDPLASEAVRDLRIDVLLNCGGGMFRKAIVEAPRLGILNLHLAPLPHYRGYNVAEWTLFHREQPGVTAHYIDVGLDTGDILLFRPLPLQSPTDIVQVRAQLGPHKIETLLDVMRGLNDGTITATTQQSKAGRQYYAMHPRLKALVDRRLAT